MTTSTIESGVRFEALPETRIEVAATLIESGTQLQHLFIGLEPVLLVQPEYDADEDLVTFNLTAVDVDPKTLISVLRALLDAAETMLEEDLKILEEIQAESTS